MRVGILGTGAVGQSLGIAFLALGHEVVMGAREAGNDKAAAFAAKGGAKARAGRFADAVEGADLVVFATLGIANPEVVAQVGPAAFSGKLVLDATNPLSRDGGIVGLAIEGSDSGGETLQRLIPTAHVVKAFNTVGNAHFYRPDFPGGPPDMFVAGNDASAKAVAAELIRAFGWEVVDVGDIRASRYLEAMCVVWVRTCIGDGNWNRALKLLAK